MTVPHEESRPPDGKSAWEPPTITLVGRVQDLVHGQGKVSGGTDSDVGNIRKVAGLA